MRFVRTAENLFGLPLGFTRVEYLQSTGTQYIDTGVFPTQLTEVEYRCAVTGSVSNVDSHLFGSRLSASSEAFDLAYMNTQPNGIEKFRFIHGTTTTQESTTSVTASQLANPHTYYMSGISFKVDGSEKMSFTTASFTGTYSLWLFGVNSAGSLHNQVRAQKVYRCKIWDNGLLVRDFIPCKDPLGVPCMYDLVGKKPYYNQGTGTFTVGRQIIPVEYLGSTGTQYIDTGVGGDLTTELTCEAAIVQAGNASVTNIMGNNVTSSRAITINMSANITNPSPSRIRFGNTDNTTDAGAINLNTFYKYDTNKNELTVRDSSGMVLNTYPLNATTAFTTNGNILIYKLGDTSTQYIGSIKVKSATIKNSGVLVRDFIPCKDENNVGFMFDKVSGTCYLNAGTGAFSVGENKYTSKLRLIKDAKELPDGYKRVEYLQSDGNQYIDTEYIPNANTECSMDLAFVSLDGTYRTPFSVRTADGATNSFTIMSVNSQQSNNSFAFGSSYWSGSSVPSVVLNKTVKAVLRKGYASWDGVSGNPGSSITPTSLTAYMFARNANGTASNFFIGRIYDCQLKDNGTLVRDFIPCLDKNNVPCMFDLVGGKPYYNLGTGSFTYGHTITPVEYLESTGTQYINTGIKLDNNSSVELDYQLTQAVQNRKGLFGGLDTGGSKRFGALLSPSNNQLEGGYGSGNEFYQLGLPDTNRHIMKQEKNLLYFDGSLVYTFNTATFTQSFNAPLGNFNYTNYNPASAKYYRSKWWDNGTLVRSFIPVRDENNVGYMFDEVTGQLFGNAGSGSFVIGNDLKTQKVRFIQDVLPREYRPLKYIQSTGTQYIDTGVNAKSTLKTDIHFEVVDKTQGGHIFGGRTVTSGGRGYGVYLPTSGGISFDYETRLSSNVSTTNGYKYRVVKDGASNTLYVNGVQSYTGSNTAATFNLNVAIALFYMKDSNTSFNASVKCKVFYFKIYDGGVPVRDLYPALRKSDNKPGMYDRITKQFFTNQGSGSDFNYEV